MISVITCSVDPRRYAELRANLSGLLNGEPHEFIVIADAKSLSEGYNRGIRQSRGGVLILCHDDIEILTPNFTSLLLERLKRFDLLGVAGTSRLTGPEWSSAGMPHLFGQIAYPPTADALYDVVQWSVPAPFVDSIVALDGLLIAGKREVFERVPFDEALFQGFHHYDLDFTYRAHLAGYKLGVCCDFAVIHDSMGNYDQVWKTYADRFEAKHRTRFAPRSPHPWQPTRIRVQNRSEILGVMRSPHWRNLPLNPLHHWTTTVSPMASTA